MTTDLEKQVLAVDFAAVETAQLLGGSALEILERQMKSENGNVRELAIMCLNAIGGPKASAVFVNALTDDYIAVRSRAAAYLMTHNAPELLGPLLEKYEVVNDQKVKAQIPLIIGRLNNPAAVPELKKRLNTSPPAESAKSLSLALARMREQPWLDDTLAQLRSPEAPVRHQGLKDLEYLGHPELLRHAAPLLEDETRLVNVGPAPSVVWLRVCDVAVIVIAKVTKHAFSFNALVEQPFTEAQIAEVRRFLTGR